MPVKLFLTADNHLGMNFSNHPANVRETLVKERFDALNTIVSLANAESADFLVVAGDLFDKVKVPDKVLKESIDILKKFQGESVLIIPGNHDFYDIEEDSLWDKFMKYSKDAQKITVLHRFEPVEFNVGNQKVVFYPACCKSKHSDQNMIGWVKDAEKDPMAINLGIAHGNVTGLGLDAADRYFNMSTEELKQAGLDLWLLGHIHVPYPNIREVTSNPVFFMPATHTPDGWKRTDAGTCWSISMDEQKNVKAQLLETSQVRFTELKQNLSSAEDFAEVEKALQPFKREKTLLSLELTGRMSQNELEALNKSLHAFRESFLFCEINNRIQLLIDKAYINKHYPENSFSHQLLSKLSENENDSLALQVANELINSQV